MMMIAIMFSLKTMELLENWLQPHSGVTPLFSLRTVSLASSQSCWSVDTDAWYKWGLELREGDIFTGACHSAQEVGVPM